LNLITGMLENMNARKLGNISRSSYPTSMGTKPIFFPPDHNGRNRQLGQPVFETVLLPQIAICFCIAGGTDSGALGFESTG